MQFLTHLCSTRLRANYYILHFAIILHFAVILHFAFYTFLYGRRKTYTYIHARRVCLSSCCRVQFYAERRVNQGNPKNRLRPSLFPHRRDFFIRYFVPSSPLLHYAYHTAGWMAIASLGHVQEEIPEQLEEQSPTRERCEIDRESERERESGGVRERGRSSIL